jgi:hypothetical protein
MFQRIIWRRVFKYGGGFISLIVFGGGFGGGFIIWRRIRLRLEADTPPFGGGFFRLHADCAIQLKQGYIIKSSNDAP